MFSPPSPEQVIPDLGDKIIGALLDAIRRTRADLSQYRTTFPQWMADHSDRGISNWIHDRLWAQLRRCLSEANEVELVDRAGTREITIGTKYRVRVKRHDARARVRSYPTATALMFWAQTDTLEGFEEVRLAFGYRWIHDERAIGAAVVSLHQRLSEDPVWVVEVEEQAGGGATPIEWRPVGPPLPQLDLFEAINGEEEAGPS